jgi:hypothetical protein
MPSKQPRIAVTASRELIDALERVRLATGTREADATLVRRLAVEGANAEGMERFPPHHQGSRALPRRDRPR